MSKEKFEHEVVKATETEEEGVRKPSQKRQIYWCKRKGMRMWLAFCF